MRSGSADPAIADSITHATYSSSREKPLLHARHAGTTGRFSGNGESQKRTRRDVVSRIIGPAAIDASGDKPVVGEVPELIHLDYLRSVNAASARAQFSLLFDRLTSSGGRFRYFAPDP